ncbi:GNAT family N-acetyltransferase [Sedimentitalea todarodis]|uniref:GNAT family N-acetyltransferase n=1 Tax=Sedimentitalea todarodis TaxID=1631240 RepID=A0ABU3VJS2_9RHOB|nr:GNAT family N-acetyltransferase [Sedimentitalea todarodis]MDU9006343.1 GNAT family N-acetyltransferase [Sedimentitalea todarodis]
MPSTEISLRTSTIADLAVVDALLSRAYPKLLKAHYPPSVLVTALPLISRAQPVLLQSGTYYVAEVEGHGIVGAGGWTRDRGSRHLGHIRHVVSDDRFQRRGIARALIRHTLNAAQAQAITEMECWSTLTAEPFYAALGFVSEGPMEITLRPGIGFPSVRMRMALPAARRRS